MRERRVAAPFCFGVEKGPLPWGAGIQLGIDDAGVGNVIELDNWAVLRAKGKAWSLELGAWGLEPGARSTERGAEFDFWPVRGSLEVEGGGGVQRFVLSAPEPLETSDDVIAGIARVGRFHGQLVGAVAALMTVGGPVAPVGVKGAVGIFAFGLGVRIGESGGEGGGGFLSADGGVVFLGQANLFLIAGGEVVGVFVDFLFGEPAGGGEVGGTGGFGNAKTLAALLVQIFGNGPLWLEGAGGAEVLLDGAEGLAVGAGDDFGDGFLDAGVLLGGFGADGDGARQGLGGNLTVIGEGAGFGGIEGAGEDTVGDLGEEELDGGMVLEEREDDLRAFFGALGMAVIFMGEAEDAAVEGSGVALEAVDTEGAAAAFFFGLGRDLGWNLGPGGVGCGVGHC